MLTLKTLAKAVQLWRREPYVHEEALLSLVDDVADVARLCGVKDEEHIEANRALWAGSDARTRCHILSNTLNMLNTQQDARKEAEQASARAFVIQLLAESMRSREEGAVNTEALEALVETLPSLSCVQFGDLGRITVAPIRGLLASLRAKETFTTAVTFFRRDPASANRLRQARSRLDEAHTVAHGARGPQRAEAREALAAAREEHDEIARGEEPCLEIKWMRKDARSRGCVRLCFNSMQPTVSAVVPLDA